jgi:hypothetical protein
MDNAATILYGLRSSALKGGLRMTVTIELPPEVQTRVLAQAEAAGMPLTEYLQTLLRGLCAADKDSAVLPTQAEAIERAQEINRGSAGESRAYDLPPEEWINRFEAWVASHSRNTVVLPDTAMERESIYGEHGR